MTTDAVLDRRPAVLEPLRHAVTPGRSATATGVGSGAGRPSVGTERGAGTVRRTARVLIVDPAAIVRLGLRQLFASDAAFSVVGEAGSPRDALVVAGRCPPDLLVLDVDLGGPDSGGIDLVTRLLQRHRGMRVLVLTASRDRDVMMRTVRTGVHGYLRKNADTTEILRAARALLRGESVFDTRSTPAPLEAVPGDDALGIPARAGAAALTERENQVLRLLATGMSNREIGTRLTISEATVKFHVRNLRDKLEVRRRTEIVYTATRQGIV